MIINNGQCYEMSSIPKPFDLLRVKKVKSSKGKCWVFHLSSNGEFTGYLFPSGFRIFGSDIIDKFGGEFFLENRNFVKSNYGLLSSLVPRRAKTEHVYACEMIVVTKLSWDGKGGSKINYHKFKGGKKCEDQIGIMLRDNLGEEYFGSVTCVDVTSINVKYMNSFHQLNKTEYGMEMNTMGPDKIYLKHEHIINHIHLN